MSLSLPTFFSKKRKKEKEPMVETSGEDASGSEVQMEEAMQTRKSTSVPARAAFPIQARIVRFSPWD